MPISCHFRDCKAILSMCSSWSSAISSTRPLPLSLDFLYTVIGFVIWCTYLYVAYAIKHCSANNTYHFCRGGNVIEAVCVAVCLSVRKISKIRVDFDEILQKGGAWHKEESVRFWWRCGPPSPFCTNFSPYICNDIEISLLLFVRWQH